MPRKFWTNFESRDLVGSDLTLLLIIILHVGEAITLAMTNLADWPIGLGTLLHFFGHRNTTIWCLLLASFAAGWAQWGNGVPWITRLILFSPQLLLLVITALGALYAASVGHYNDFVVRPGIGIFWDKYMRTVAPILYAIAVWVRIRAR